MVFAILFCLELQIFYLLQQPSDFLVLLMKCFFLPADFFSLPADFGILPVNLLLHIVDHVPDSVVVHDLQFL
jgi:hypothetical protein